MYGGRVAVVTGGGSGIGRRCVEVLCARGARVVAADANGAAAEAVAAEQRRGGAQCVAQAVDVTAADAYALLFRAAETAFGAAVWLLVLNAGVQEPAPYCFAAAGGPPFAAFERVLAVNTTAVLRGVHELCLWRSPLCDGSAARVAVAVASIAGTVPQPESPVYAGSKAAVVNFVRSAAWLRDAVGVRLSCVCPHFTDTPMVTRFAGDAGQQFARKLTGGILTPDDIAAAVLRVVDDETLNGAVLRVVIGRGQELWPRAAARPAAPAAAETEAAQMLRAKM